MLKRDNRVVQGNRPRAGAQPVERGAIGVALLLPIILATMPASRARPVGPVDLPAVVTSFLDAVTGIAGLNVGPADVTEK